MTVPTEIARSPVYEGDGVNNLWPFNFRAIAATDLVLFRRSVAGEETQITSGFTVVGLGQQAGGTVTYPTGSARLQVGEKIVVVRRPPFLQLLALTQDVNLFRDQMENQFDRQTFMSQALRDQGNRSLQLQQTSPLPYLYMPPGFPNAPIGWNADGTGLVNFPVGSGSSGSSGLELHDLTDDGTTDQAAALVTLIAQAVAEGWRELRITGREDSSSAILLDRRAVVDAMPPATIVSRVALTFNAANSAGLYIRGREIELPASGKAKLWANVDVSGGAVAAFDIDVSANASIVPLLVAGAIVIVRGQNGADGDVLDGHRHEAEVVSLVLVSGTRYTLTLDAGLPDTIDGSVWLTEWPDSEHATDPDETLISVLAVARATANLTDSRTMSIESGAAAAMELQVGQWVEVIDDATGADTHGTSAELLNRQTIRVAEITPGTDPTDDLITFDEQVRGALTTAKRARLVMLTACQPFKLQGPGPAFPIRVIGTPPASPASRRHIIEVKYCIRPEITGWFYAYVEADGATRGTIIRDSNCFEPWVHHNGVAGPWPDFAGAFNGGDYYGVWSKGSTRPLHEHNTVVGGRHCLVIANAKSPIVRFNRLGYSGFQCLDFHGENEINVEAYGNAIVRGPAWADRGRHVAIQLGNQTHTYGTRGALIRDNEIIGFDAAADVGVLIVSGCRDIIIDQHFRHPVGEAVRIDADNRAPAVTIERVTIAGSTPAATVGVVIDGQMQIWESGGEVEGSASRPVSIDDSTGTRRYSTPGAGTLGTVNPTATSGTEVSGDITLTYVGLVSAQPIPIDGVRVLADLAQATTSAVQYRAANVVFGNDYLPNPIESDGFGLWPLSWETDLRAKGIAVLSRASGDVADLVAVLPANLPLGPLVTLLFPEAATIRAQAKVFDFAASWEDDSGEGLVTIDAAGVTTTTLGLVVGDAAIHSVSTTISEIVSATQFKTVATSGTGSGTASVMAPADSIDGEREIGTPAIAVGGTAMVFYRVSASTATTRGTLKSGERPPVDGDFVNASTVDLADGDAAVAVSVDRVNITGTAADDVSLALADGSPNQQLTIVMGGALAGFDLTLTSGVADVVAEARAESVYRLRWNTTGTPQWIVEGAYHRTAPPGVLGQLDAISLADHIDATGTADTGKVPAIAEGGTLVWATNGGGISSVTESVVTVDTSTELTAALHGIQAPSGSSLERRKIRARNSSSTASAVALTIEDGLAATIDIFVADDQTGAVTITRSGSDTINGGTAITLAGAGASGRIIPLGSGAFRFEGGTTESRSLAANLAEKVNAAGNLSGSASIDWRLGSYVTCTLTANVTALAITNPPASGLLGSITVEINHGTGPYTWSHPTGIKWGSGVAPTLSDGASEITVLTYWTRDGGTTWFGFLGGENMS